MVLLYDVGDHFVSSGALISDGAGNKYLVGARHTFYNERVPYYRTALRLRHAGGTHPYSQQDQVEIQAAEGNKFLWSQYDASTDIGLLPLPADKAARLPEGIASSRLAGRDAQSKGTPLIVVGGTTAMPTEDLREPIFVPAMVATSPQPHLGGQILISASLTPGNSGSSVFENQQAGPPGKQLGRLIGIVSEAAFTVDRPGSIGYVEPAYKISDLLRRLKQNPECCRNPLRFTPAP